MKLTRKKTNILLCSPIPGYSGGISRWAEHILNYYDNLLDKPVNLTLFPMPRKHFIGYVSLIRRIWLGILDYGHIYWKYRQTIKHEKPNISHIVSSASLSLFKDILMLKVSKRKNIFTIVHFHFGRIPELFIKKKWEYKVLCYLVNLADKVVVIDLQSYNTLQKMGFSNITLLPNPLAPSLTHFVSKHNNVMIDNRKIVFAGQIIKTKGIFELLDACKTIPNIHLTMLGYVDENMKKQIFEHLGPNDCSWVEICGNQPQDTVLHEMLSAGVFVLPTYTEGFPNVILESMACGCPIVASNVGSIPQMLDVNSDTSYGMCIEPKNKIQLRNAILKMLDNREFALECGRNAKKRVNELYSMSIVWQKMVDIWDIKNN